METSLLRISADGCRVDEAFTGLIRLALQDASWMGPDGADGSERRFHALPLPSPSIAKGQQCAFRGCHQAFPRTLFPTLEPGNVAQHTQTPLQASSVPPESSPCVPPHCSTPVMSVVPLVPLAWCLGAWLAPPARLAGSSVPLDPAM
ncbi:hypothetical protein PO909_032611 [Leuciscus waleckii]